jgi:hypothetical protein
MSAEDVWQEAMVNRQNPIQAYTLDAGRIIKTVEHLQQRIEARFPGSGLAQVCAGLAQTARATSERARKLARPYYGLRLLVVAVVVAAIGAQIYVAELIDWGDVIRKSDPVGVTQALDAAVNLLVLAFGAIWFLMTAEIRLKRRRVLRWLHELRSTAHVIDMHQLTKDPSIELGLATVTPVSPKRQMKDFELSRYLDYCSEMLAIIAKLAALYAGEIEDPGVISAVNEVEGLTTDLGRKIWQKIILISNLEDRPARSAG